MGNQYLNNKMWYTESEEKDPPFVLRQLKTEIDLHNFGLKARNRKHWRIIRDSIMQAAYSNTAAYNLNTGDSDGI